jgi:hypothetical protein
MVCLQPGAVDQSVSCGRRSFQDAPSDLERRATHEISRVQLGTKCKRFLKILGNLARVPKPVDQTLALLEQEREGRKSAGAI